MYRQYDLQAGDKHITCWLKEPRNLHKGMLFVLKGDSTIWKVIKRYDITLENPPRTDWSNNI